MVTVHLRAMNLHVLQIILVILGYCSVSIALVFANKYLVGSQASTRDVSLFVVWVQCVVTVTVVTSVNVTKAYWTNNWTKVAVPRENLLAVPIVKMSCTFVCMLAFNNLCLRYVDVSFYQVARSMTIIFVVIFSIMILKQSVSWRVVLCCVVVAAGFFLGVDQEQLLGTLSVTGVFYGIMSSVFVALNGAFIKQALDAVDGDSYRLTYYGNINATFLFLPLIYMMGQFHEAYSSLSEWTVAFWVFLLFTGVLTFLIAWIGGLQIKLTSVISHHIIANTKAVLQTLIAVLYYNEIKPLLWWSSILLVVGGAFSYTMVKIKETEWEKKQYNTQDNTEHKSEMNGFLMNNVANRALKHVIGDVEIGKPNQMVP